jgi:hypothetical protein
MVAFHEVGVQAELNAHLTADQMDNIAKHAESMDSATNKAIGSFTDVVSHFAGQWAVSGDQINQFLFTSLGQVNQWASDLKAASAAGIDGGIIDQLRAAGPQSEAVLRGLLNDVANGGLDAINSAQKSIQAIEADLNQSLDQNAIVAQIKILETAQVAQAAFAALNDDGGAQLLQLAQKGDEATKKAADAMIYNLIGSGKVPLAIAGIQEQLNSIHGKDVDINVRYNVLETVVASSSAAATGAALAGVTGVPPSTSTGNAALDAFLGSLPKTAVGGIFDKPEARTIAEAGPEAVIPLNDPGRAWDLIRQSGLLNSMPMSSGLMDSLDANTSAVSAAISGGIGASVGPSEDRSVTIQNLIVNAPRPDPMAIAYETARELAAENYRSGR